MDLPESGTPVPRNQRGGRGTARIALDMLGLLKAWVAGGDIQDLADGYLGAVADPEFRLEQLADFITAAFDNSFAVGIWIGHRWVNARLDTDENPDVSISASLPFLIRYGVNSQDAVRLIRGGVVSRRLATVVAEDFQANGDGEQDLREWLCGMDLAVWRARFTASPMDLRAMLEFARPRGHRLAARLLGGELVTIQIRAVGEPRASATAAFGDVADELPPARARGVGSGGTAGRCSA